MRKYDPDGEVLWTMAPDEFEDALFIACDVDSADNIIAVGRAFGGSGPAIIAKYAP